MPHTSFLYAVDYITIAQPLSRHVSHNTHTMLEEVLSIIAFATEPRHNAGACSAH